MNREGYSNKMRYALINADDMKEVLLCGHSEKLAMAFGILNLVPGRTVRVTKNLRVCEDCHEMRKFMSKTTGRENVLRDSNRFHHFKDEFWKQIPPSEPYCVILGDVRDKLYNIRERARYLLANGSSEIPEETTFTNVEQFLEPLELCYRSLLEVIIYWKMMSNNV
ncbi:Pentatricopeptide repeat-containing protein DOT4, chloroplastic, partial [Mucuna pruriens]